MIDLSVAVAGVKPGVVQEFLRNRGWRLVESSDKVAVYQRDGYELEVPLHEHYVDYSRRIVELLEPLAELEEVSPLTLVDDLSRPPSDVLAVRVEGDLAATGTL